MKNNNMLTLLLSDDEVDFLDALCFRLKVSPDILIGNLLQWAAIFSFSDSSRRMILGRRADYWSPLVDEEFERRI